MLHYCDCVIGTLSCTEGICTVFVERCISSGLYQLSCGMVVLRLYCQISDQKLAFPVLSESCVTTLSKFTPCDSVTSVMSVWRKRNINRAVSVPVVSCTVITVHDDTSSSYRSVDWSGFDLDWLSSLSPVHLCTFDIRGAIQISFR